MSAQKSGFTNFKNWSNKKIKDPIFWVKFAAYAIPAAFLIYVLYMNFLPFGYSKTFVINVGSATDTKVGEFYLEPSKDLSERKVSTDGATTYRELNGMANVVFKPKAVLKNAEITVSVEGEGISIIPPHIDFDPSTVNWDYNWDFTKEIPKDLTGNAFMFDDEATFNGKDTRLELPNSADKFEDGPTSIYAEWTPTDSENNYQQIVGHFNWELWQNKENVEFRVGRMNDGQGPVNSIEKPVSTDFFGQPHSALAIYNPGDNGYIEFYVDGNFSGRTYFKTDKIWKDYGNQNVSAGKSGHGSSTFFKGNIGSIQIVSKNVLPSKSTIISRASDVNNQKIFLASPALAQLKAIELYAIRK